MEVAAFLPPLLLSHLRIVVGHDHSLLAVDSWTALTEVVRRSIVDVLVVDPAADGTARSVEIATLLQRFPSVPVVLYMTLAPSTLRAVVSLGRFQLDQVVLYRFDDEPRRFRELIERQPGNTVGEAVLRRLGPALALVDARLAEAVERLFRQPQQFTTVHDLARDAGLMMRAVYRQCERAGLASPRMLVMGARLTRAYVFMRDPGYTIEDVTIKMGYSAPRMFARHMKVATGWLPSEVRASVTAAQLVERLVDALYPTERAAAPRSSTGAAHEA